MSSRFYLTLCACMCFLGIGQSQPPFTEIPIDTLAYRGCSAQLNCSISDLGDTISWYAEVDGQYQQISSGNETYDKHFKVIGDHLMGEFHLFIDFVEKSIESVYECTVHQTGVSTAARLFVLESGPFCNVKGTSVIENLGSVTFTCWVDLPDDAPGQLVWRNNGKEVARTQEKTNYYMKRVFDRSEDGDEYTCIFEYQNAYICLELQSLNCSEEFIIDVQYPPDVSLRNAVGSSVAVIEGESYTNFCIVYSNPSATVEWIHGGKVVENYGLLDLQNVQRYQNGTYTCHANTTFWNSDSGSGSLSFKLDVQYSPEISLVGSNDDVVEGNTYSRVCSVKSNPAATVEWLYEEIFVTASNTLTLANVRRNLKGTYICQARNTFWQGENRTSSESFVLNVQYPPTVSTVERVERREGQSVSLTCNLESGNPAAEDNIGWVLLKGEMRFGTNLDLTNVTRDMTGYYTCVARNTFYDNTLGVGNSTTYVDVHYKPSVQRSKFSDKVEAEITANASLVCVVSANPTPTFKWHKDGKSVDGSSEETTEGTETTSTLTLTFVSNADYGEYISTATNDLLEDQCKIKLVRIELSSEDSTPWYWPAIIVTCSCLFIGGAVFLGCVLYKRRKSLLVR